MKRKYDLVIPLGNACSCSMTLREAGLQLLSLPFDWVGPGSVDKEVPLDLGKRVRAICSNFEGWMDPADFERFADSGGQETTEYYRNSKTKFLFLHDFPKNIPFETAYPDVMAKHQRRINRLFQLIEGSQRVLLFRLDRPDARIRTPVAACQEALRLLRERFPGKAFDLVLMQQDDAIPFAMRTVTAIEPGLTSIRFDYHLATSALPSTVNLKLTAAALKSLYSVRDYRTAGERRKNRKAQLLKLFDKLKRSFAKRLGRGVRKDHE